MQNKGSGKTIWSADGNHSAFGIAIEGLIRIKLLLEAAHWATSKVASGLLVLQLQWGVYAMLCQMLNDAEPRAESQMIYFVKGLWSKSFTKYMLGFFYADLA